MFGHVHYVPILRWKEAERFALRDVRSEDREIITPLVELIPRDFEPDTNGKPRQPEKVVANIAEQIDDCWGDEYLFVDPCHLDPKLRVGRRTHVFEAVCADARSRGLRIIPVTDLWKNSAYQSKIGRIVKVDGHGACIRVRSSDIRHAKFASRLQELASYFELKPSQIDLLVDCQFLDKQTPDIDETCIQIPDLKKWRSFTFVSGNFPKNLTAFSVAKHELTRLDWLTWRDYMLNTSRLTRRPSFGDYTIQHAVYGEPPSHPNPSVSIRYTADDHWVIMRGQGLRTDGSPGTAQWPANAQMLIERQEFRGPDFSAGDWYIQHKSEHPKPTGSFRTWLQAGINHHLTLVSRQIASFFGAPVAGAR